MPTRAYYIIGGGSGETTLGRQVARALGIDLARCLTTVAEWLSDTDQGKALEAASEAVVIYTDRLPGDSLPPRAARALLCEGSSFSLASHLCQSSSPSRLPAGIAALRIVGFTRLSGRRRLAIIGAWRTGS